MERSDSPSSSPCPVALWCSSLLGGSHVSLFTICRLWAFISVFITLQGCWKESWHFSESPNALSTKAAYGFLRPFSLGLVILRCIISSVMHLNLLLNVLWPTQFFATGGLVQISQLDIFENKQSVNTFKSICFPPLHHTLFKHRNQETWCESFVSHYISSIST